MARWTRALLVFVLGLGASPQGTQELRAQEMPSSMTGPTLVLATYNIRYGLADDGPNRWEARRDVLAGAIADLDPDVCALQEALLFQIDDLTRALPQYTVIGVGRDDGLAQGEFSPLLVRTTRFIVADSGTFWLSENPEQPGSKSWDAAFPRICTRARLIDRSSGKAINVYGTHFDHQSQRARDNSATLILDRIASRTNDDPVVLLGDFNAGEDNPAIATVLSARSPRARLIDAYRAGHPAGADPDETTGTFTAFDPGATRGPMIDHVFVSPGLAVRDARIARPRSPDGARAPSDHDPVVATLAWPGAG